MEIAMFAAVNALVGVFVSIGLLVATALTLLFLPALYAAWFKVPSPDMKQYGL